MNHVDELISASLTGDLTDTERHQLETHLDSCPRCRATLAAFTDQRRLVSGLRHVPPPRDLGARVRGGLESGRRVDVPWWRRPTGILTALGSVGAVAAGAVLAVVLFNQGPPQQVASSVEPFVTSTASPSPIPTESLTPTPVETPAPTPVPSASTVSDITKPSGYFVYQVRNQSGSIVYSGRKEISLKLDGLGMPARASLSPDGAWVAFRIDGDLSGFSDFYALRVSDGAVFSLGKSLQPAYGLGERLSWSPDSKSVIYTLTTPDSKIDAWLFTTDDQQAHQMTNTGDTFAASWTDTGDVWLSRAAAQPASYLISTHGEGVTMPFDPASIATDTAAGVFEPLVSPDGKRVIFWRGTMGTPGGHWSFSEGAMPWLANVSPNGQVDFANARQVFSTLAGGREMFRGASVTWGPDSDAFAVWNAQWTGVPQGDRFPDSTRVYFGHVSNPELITAGQTLDEADTKDATDIVDVAIAADGDHLALTVVLDAGAEGGSFGPTAQLRLVTRGYGTDPDKVEIIGQDKVWYGPAVYPSVAH
jgi:hypothetical protein